MRAALDERLRNGVLSRCPCCGQHAKVYPRKLNRMMIRSLAFLVRHGARRPVDCPRWMMAGREYAKLALWGLAETHKADDSDPVWYATPLGHQFARGRVDVPTRAYVYNGNVIAFSDERVTFAECVDEFDLGDLLNPVNVADATVGAAA